MELIADGLLIAGALAAAFYCYILSRRVRRLANLDDGLGAAIAQLSRQVEGMRAALKETQATSQQSFQALGKRIEEAEQVAARLEELGEEYAPPARRSATKRKKPTRSTSAPSAAQPVDTKPAKRASSQSASPTELRPSTSPELASLVPPKPNEAGRKQSTEPPQETDDRVRTAARQLQEDIRQRVLGGPDKGEKDNFVKALQSVLSSSSR